MSLKEKIGEDIVVHSGRFHMDDVLAVALWLLVNERQGHKVEFFRTRNPEEFRGIVVDVGEGRYDHHGLMAGQYDQEGIPYCGVTRLWWDGLNLMLFPDSIKNVEFARTQFYREILLPLAQRDNGEEESYSCPLQFIYSFNKLENEATSSDEMFEEAVKVTRTVIERYIKSAKQKAEDRFLLEGIEVNDGIAVMPRFLLGWQKVLPWKGAKLVVYPCDGEYRLQTVDSYEISIIDFLDENQEDITFVHQDGFLAGFASFYSCIEYAKKIIAEFNSKREEEEKERRRKEETAWEAHCKKMQEWEDIPYEEDDE